MSNQISKTRTVKNELIISCALLAIFCWPIIVTILNGFRPLPEFISWLLVRTFWVLYPFELLVSGSIGILQPRNLLRWSRLESSDENGFTRRKPLLIMGVILVAFGVFFSWLALDYWGVILYPLAP